MIALIACSAKKLDRRAPARELYRGTLFRYSVRYAETVLQIPWYVLSAKWGLVAPDEELEPYDDTLRGAKKLSKRVWALDVAKSLDEPGLNTPGQTWIMLAGRDYRDQLYPVLRGTIEVPLRGLGIGQQVSVLKAWCEGQCQA